MDQSLIALRFDFLPPRPLMSAKEVAYAMGWQIDTVRVYRRRGSVALPWVRVGGRYFYRTDDVMRFMKSLPPTKKQRLKAYHAEQQARTIRAIPCQPSA
jgi:hypothetical protein